MSTHQALPEPTYGIRGKRQCNWAQTAEARTSSWATGQREDQELQITINSLDWVTPAEWIVLLQVYFGGQTLYLGSGNGDYGAAIAAPAGSASESSFTYKPNNLQPNGFQNLVIPPGSICYFHSFQLDIQRHSNN